MGFFKKKTKKNKKNKEEAAAAAEAAAAEAAAVAVDEKSSIDNGTAVESPNNYPSGSETDEFEDASAPPEDEVEDPSPDSSIGNQTEDEFVVEQDTMDEEEDVNPEQLDKSESYQELENIEENSQYENEQPMKVEDEPTDPVESERKNVQTSWEESSQHESVKEATMSEDKGAETSNDGDKYASDASAAPDKQPEDLDYTLSSTSFRKFVNSMTSSKGNDDEPMSFFGIKCGEGKSSTT